METMPRPAFLCICIINLHPSIVSEAQDRSFWFSFSTLNVSGDKPRLSVICPFWVREHGSPINFCNWAFPKRAVKLHNLKATLWTDFGFCWKCFTSRFYFTWKSFLPPNPVSFQFFGFVVNAWTLLPKNRISVALIVGNRTFISHCFLNLIS